MMSHARSATVSLASLLMVVVYPVSRSLCHVYSLPPDLTRRSEPNLGQELVCVPVRIQISFLHK